MEHNLTRTTLRLETNTYEEIRKIAYEENAHCSDIIRECLTIGLNQRKKLGDKSV